MGVVVTESVDMVHEFKLFPATRSSQNLLFIQGISTLYMKSYSSWKLWVKTGVLQLSVGAGTEYINPTASRSSSEIHVSLFHGPIIPGLS